MSNPQATAKIAGHPLHPMLVPFPIAGFVGALVCDLIGTADPFWFRASEYLLAALGSQGWTDWLRYAQGELYRRRAAAGDLDKAVGSYGTGISGGGAMPELWRGRGLALLKLGLTDEGRADLREYVRRAPAASDKAMIAMMAGG